MRNSQGNNRQHRLILLSLWLLLTTLSTPALAWSPWPQVADPLIWMPGSQPADRIHIGSPAPCLACHANYDPRHEPGFNWQGSMMAQTGRDPLMWAALTVAGQDAIWALGNPNATDLCLRCHFPAGWLAGRAEPSNGAALTGNDYDGVSCDFCHRLWDPFFATPETRTLDEAGLLSRQAATRTNKIDRRLSVAVQLFDPGDFFINGRPRYAGSYNENSSGQFFVSRQSIPRASFADANTAGAHQTLYSRYHKSSRICASCHDVSNPVLANLEKSSLPDRSNGEDLISEQYAADRYFHLERTSSEFALSAYARDEGAATNLEFSAMEAGPERAASCQDCHMRDLSGRAAVNGLLRPQQSREHPDSGQPLHDLSGGNSWVPYILASLDEKGPVFDRHNRELLEQGPKILTLDLNQGITPQSHSTELLAAAERALTQLRLAASIKRLNYDPVKGRLSLRIQNNSGHKLITGFSEGRRMFLNIKTYRRERLIDEINPYSEKFGTLKGLPHAASAPPLTATEHYLDALVYQVQLQSDLTGEQQSSHVLLATGRFKDNRIPPKGFAIAEASARLCEPVWQSQSAIDYFSTAEYAGGYDDIELDLPAGADRVIVSLFYQGVSREYVEFLRDEINGTATSLKLDEQGKNPAGGRETYLIQSDPFFKQLKAWGDTIWELWQHNHGLDGSGAKVPGIVPVMMASRSWKVATPVASVTKKE